MFTISYAFAYSVLGFYSGYRYMRDQTELYRDSIWIHFKWCLYFMAIVLLVIYTANRVANEVILGSSGKTYSKTFNFSL